ncbi:Inositol 1,4,5-trisphosphate receptor type 2 [Varanus komodoensis]|nr:Inositol 1,4,5-trisphosphate receptor type 2 [Varanus komodoensis]
MPSLLSFQHQAKPSSFADFQNLNLKPNYQCTLYSNKCPSLFPLCRSLSIIALLPAKKALISFQRTQEFSRQQLEKNCSNMFIKFRKQSCKEATCSIMLTYLCLFDLVYREETLLNVIKSVTRNGRSIILTAVLALILVYLFSIVGFLFLKDDFIMEVERLKNRTTIADSATMPTTGLTTMVNTCSAENCSTTIPAIKSGEETDEDGIERTCDTLLMCIVTVLNQGLRNGGGVGDVLRKPSKDVSIYLIPIPPKSQSCVMYSATAVCLDAFIKCCHLTLMDKLGDPTETLAPLIKHGCAWITC